MRRWAAFRSDERGGVATIVAIVAPVLLGLSAYAVDLVYYNLVDNRLQTAADAAALAGVRYIKTDPKKVPSEVIAFARKNVRDDSGTVTRTDDIELGWYDPRTKSFSIGGRSLNAVRVTANRDTDHGNEASRFFGSIFGDSATAISATSIAVLTPPNDCVIALDKTAPNAITANGNGGMSVPSCGMHANSSSGRAINASGSSTMKARQIKTVGGYSGSNFTPEPLVRQPAIDDPLAYMDEPDIPSTCTTQDATIHGRVSFPDGSRFCGTTTIGNGARVTLEPGIHFVTGGELVLKKTADLFAEGVMIYFDKDSWMTSSSQGSVRITAGQTGYYTGVAIFQSRDVVTPPTFKLTGKKEFFLGGTIYLPRANVEFYGTTDMSAIQEVGYLIANRLSYTGNSTLIFDSYGLAAKGMLSRAVLVY